jgi:HlyD family secretion protein
VKRIILLAVAVAALAAGAFLYLRARAGGQAPRYETAEAARGHIANQVTATGTLSPVVTVEVGSQVSGRIQELLVDFNSRVVKGQVIARIDPEFIQADVAKARANLASARAALARAEAEKLDARKKLDRSLAMAAQELVARADTETAQATYDTALASVAAARAVVTQARAALAQQETNLTYTTIRSPIDGIVISREVQVGQTVAASLQAPKLFTIAEDLAVMEVHTSVAESDVGSLVEGMPVEFTVDAFPAEKFAGTVKQVRYSPTTVQNVVTYDAVVAVDNRDLKLRPGMTADVSFLVQERDDALLVANAALRFRPPDAPADPLPAARAPAARQARGSGGAPRAGRANRRVVWKLAADGKPVAVPVAIGISDGRQTEIVSGALAAGDRVITGIAGQAQPAGGAQQQQQQQQRGNQGGRARMGRFL